MANRIMWPWGHTGASPDEPWRDRNPITADERDRFIRAISGALGSLGYLTKHALKGHRDALPPNGMDGEDTETNAEKILACFASRDTIRPGAGAASIVSTAPRSPPARAGGEAAHHSLWRRAFTLVIRFAKAAKIMG